MRLILNQVLIISSCFVLMGCSLFQKETYSEGGVFRSSASDVQNRASDGFTLPQNLISGEAVIDPLNMQSKADYHFAMAESFSLEGKPTNAIEQFKMTLIYDPKSPVVRLRLAKEYVKIGLISESIRLTKESVVLDPSNPESHLLLGGLYSTLRLFEKAIEEYEIVMELEPNNEDAPVYLGAIFVEQRKFDDAIAYFDKLAKSKTYEDSHKAYYYKGRVYLEKGEKSHFKEAKQAFEKALSIKPDFVDAVLSLAEVYENEGMREEGLGLLSGYQERFGPNLTVADQLGRIYMESSELDKAYEQFEIIEGGDPDNLNVKIKMAFILIDREKYQLAIQRLEDILIKAPGSDKVLFYLGAVYEELKDYKKAITQFQQIKPDSVYFAESIVHASYLYKLLGDYKAAIAVIESGLKYTKDNPQFYALYASYLDELKKYDLAVELLAEAVQRFPRNPQLRFFLGSMWDRKGHVDNTISSMRLVLDIDENHVQALNYLAYTLAENNIDLNEAESLARKALTLQPNDGYILDTLGWIQFKRGDTKGAIQTLETAHELQKDEAIIAEHLGDAYFKYQMREQAILMYQRAAQLESDSIKLVKIQEKLKRVQNTIDPQIMGRGMGRMPASQ